VFANKHGHASNYRQDIGTR